MEILSNKIQAPGYLVAVNEQNDMVIESYQNARFIGVMVPHIDPVKEVTAERMKLGNKFVPLTTAQKATEAVGGGDYDSNVDQVIEEVKLAEELNFEAVEVPEPEPPEQE